MIPRLPLRARLSALLLILGVAASIAAGTRKEPLNKPLQYGDRVRLKNDEFGPTWYVIKHFGGDVLIDNGRDQAYMATSEVVRDVE